MIEDGNWIPAASIRCCICKPDGPAAVSLGKKPKDIPMMLKLGGKMGSSVIGGGVCGFQTGVFEARKAKPKKKTQSDFCFPCKNNNSRAYVCFAHIHNL